LIQRVQPDEIYNLAAQSFVAVSFDQPSATSQITGIGALNLLEAIRLVKPSTRFYQASSSEMFGKVRAIPQDEDTPFYPRSPYGVSKLYAHWMTINYRESHNLFACSGILFNHESPLRGREFVTRKISDSVAKIALGKMSAMELGNIDAKRDWGYAKEYVEGMWSMLQHSEPESFVLATGRTETVREFVRMAFKVCGIIVEFSGANTTEVATVTNVTQAKTSVALSPKVGQIVMTINPTLYRPAEVELLVGDASRARRVIGWEPKTTLEQICSMMVSADLSRNLNGFSF
jgi:GDPmannose 4,6-dehydratase